MQMLIWYMRPANLIHTVQKLELQTTCGHPLFQRVDSLVFSTSREPCLRCLSVGLTHVVGMGSI